MKRTLFISAVTFMFISCNKCVECTDGDSLYYGGSSGNHEFDERFGDEIHEVCSDNFESKKDFNDYIEAREDNDDWDCKSDFWN